MKTIEIKVYKFSELSETAKENAIKLWYESEEYEYLCDDILSFISDNDTYFSDIKLQYSLNYCQGDGLSFSGRFNFAKWINDKYNFKEPNGKYNFKELIKNALINIVCSVESTGNNGRYCYASKNDIIYEESLNSGVLSDLNNLYQLIDNIISDISDYYIDLCRKAEKYGYSILEYRMNEREMNDICEANDYHFYEDGTMY